MWPLCVLPPGPPQHLENVFKKIFLRFIIFFLIWLGQVLVASCMIFHCDMQDLVPWWGIKPRSPILRTQSLNHWTTREVPREYILNTVTLLFKKSLPQDPDIECNRPMQSCFSCRRGGLTIPPHHTSTSFYHPRKARVVSPRIRRDTWKIIYKWTPVSWSSLFDLKVKVLVAQSCLTLQPVDCSPPGSSVHGILQARILEWIAIIFSTLWLSTCQVTFYWKS